MASDTTVLATWTYDTGVTNAKVDRYRHRKNTPLGEFSYQSPTATTNRGNPTSITMSYPGTITGTTVTSCVRYTVDATYNKLGQTKTVHYPALGQLPEETLTNTYVRGGAFRSLTTDNGTANLATATYDSYNRLAAVVSGRRGTSQLARTDTWTSSTWQLDTLQARSPANPTPVSPTPATPTSTTLRQSQRIAPPSETPPPQPHDRRLVLRL